MASLAAGKKKVTARCVLGRRTLSPATFSVCVFLLPSYHDEKQLWPPNSSTIIYSCTAIDPPKASPSMLNLWNHDKSKSSFMLFSSTTMVQSQSRPKAIVCPFSSFRALNSSCSFSGQRLSSPLTTVCVTLLCLSLSCTKPHLQPRSLRYWAFHSNTAKWHSFRTLVNCCHPGITMSDLLKDKT